MPTDILNQYGLSKTLLTRRETIYLKHILKNIFVYGSEDELLEKLNNLQFKSLFKYFEYITNKLRGIYKLPREVLVDNADDLVKMDRNQLIKILELYKSVKSIIILDFDNTITNPKFHALYRWIMENKYKVIINSGNPSRESIAAYLNKHGLKQPEVIYVNKGKKKKIVRLKEIAISNLKE
jgi:hypothetical protein